MNTAAQCAFPGEEDWTALAATANAREGAAEGRRVLIDGSMMPFWRASEAASEPPKAAEEAGGSRGREAAVIASHRNSIIASREVSLMTVPSGSGDKNGMKSRECVVPVRSSPGHSDGDDGGDLSSWNVQRVLTSVSGLASRAGGQHRNTARCTDWPPRVKRISDTTRYLLDDVATRANETKLAVREKVKTQLAESQGSMTIEKRSRQRARREAAVSCASKLACAQKLEARVNTLVESNLELLQENRSIDEQLAASAHPAGRLHR